MKKKNVMQAVVGIGIEDSSLILAAPNSN